MRGEIATGRARARCHRRRLAWIGVQALPTLASEGIIDRDQRGVVVAVRRRALIKRWARDYSFAKTNASVGYFISPRGLDRTLSRLTDLSAPVTLTGSAAARRLLPRAPLRWWRCACSRSIPTPRARWSTSWVSSPAEPTTANTVLAVPQDGEVLAAHLAPVALVLADLPDFAGPQRRRGRATYGGARPHRRRVEGLMDIAPEYVVARRVLLDALAALEATSTTSSSSAPRPSTTTPAIPT